MPIWWRLHENGVDEHWLWVLFLLLYLQESIFANIPSPESFRELLWPLDQKMGIEKALRLCSNHGDCLFKYFGILLVRLNCRVGKTWSYWNIEFSNFQLYLLSNLYKCGYNSYFLGLGAFWSYQNGRWVVSNGGPMALFHSHLWNIYV